MAVVWRGKTDLLKWGRVWWADYLIGINYPDAVAMWHLGLEGAYGRPAGKDLCNGLSINVLGRGLKLAAYKGTGTRLAARCTGGNCGGGWNPVERALVLIEIFVNLI